MNLFFTISLKLFVSNSRFDVYKKTPRVRGGLSNVILRKLYAAASSFLI